MTSAITPLVSIQPLQEAFNTSANKTRLVALLSPTCSGCAYGADGIMSLLQRHENDDGLAIYVVWLPMLPTDDKDALNDSPFVFDDGRVTQFFDPNRLSGIGYMRDVFPRLYKDAYLSMLSQPIRKELKPLKPMLKSLVNARPESAPLWDAALFYSKGSRWEMRFPVPTCWMKQIAYFGGAELDGATGVFWVNDAKQPMAASDWAKLADQLYSATLL